LEQFGELLRLILAAKNR